MHKANPNHIVADGRHRILSGAHCRAASEALRQATNLRLLLKRRMCTLREGSFRQDSLSLQPGSCLPHCIARAPAGLALPLWFCLPVPSESIKRSGHASRPALLVSLTPYPQPTAGRGTVPLHFMKTRPLQATLAPASGG